MVEFLLSIIVFLAAHTLPARTGLRDRGIARIGRPGYMAVYSLLSLGLTIWVFAAYARAPHVGLWDVGEWQFWVPVLVMPFALALFCVGAVIANPLSISFRKAPADRPAPAFAGLIRHPVLWGFGLWAGAHVPPNGDLASIILFGGLCAFSFAGMGVFDRRKQRQLGEDQWQRLVQGDAAWRTAEPGVKLRAAADRTVISAIVTGVVIYGLLLVGGHQHLFGVDPLAGFR